MDNLPEAPAWPPGVEPATPAHAARLASCLAPRHRREVRDVSGLDPGRALSLSLAGSLEAYAFCPRPGEPLFMMGVEPASPLTGDAMVWLLGRAGMERRPRGLLRAARWGLGRAFAVTGAAALVQIIPAWYGAGLRFAARMGFLPVGDADGLVHVRCERSVPWEAR